ncbi:hypothetical protein [Nostoc sp.]|uniref:hypothetical protein n=1 Tax=Nostoc sp. TaxID=1180 RepID=UPI002FFBCF14
MPFYVEDALRSLLPHRDTATAKPNAIIFISQSSQATSFYILNKSDRPQNTIIPPQNKNILVWNRNILT